MYDISLSIVTYNNEGIIEKTVESLISHLENRFRYILYIIDNNSKDDTVKKVQGCNGDIVIIQNLKNLGFGAGHNKVLDKIDSKYHIVVNPDITITNEVISDMFEYMENNKEIGLLTPLVKHPDGQIQYLCKRNPTVTDLFIRLFCPKGFKKRQDYFTMKETGYDKPFYVEYATGCFMFFRTEIFKQLKGFDEHIFLYLEDADITRRVNQITKTLFFPYNYVVHDWQRGAHKSLKLMWINVKSAIWYFCKWGR
ncbi:MAG: glycosyltransferase family 2 protein [Acetivibrionales bacterium]|jgi:GT2 family glycosyltransferase